MAAWATLLNVWARLYTAGLTVVTLAVADCNLALHATGLVIVVLAIADCILALGTRIGGVTLDSVGGAAVTCSVGVTPGSLTAGAALGSGLALIIPMHP